MRCVIQRVSKASVSMEGNVTGAIDQGFLVLLGVSGTDTKADMEYCLKKTLGLRVFEDDDGKMNRSLSEVNGQVLCVSQFTLYGDVRHGRRPSFIEAAGPDLAIPLYEGFIEGVRSAGIDCQTGVFGADMDITLCNTGPVTILVDSRKGF